MANSKYEYVRLYEQSPVLLPNTWIVVRIDGRGFSKLTAKYSFTKPNDKRALDLMNAAAHRVLTELPDLVLAYGNSDEFSFVFHKDCALFERRESKLVTTIVSTFTAAYVHFWPDFMVGTKLTPPLPTFDGRAVCYPSDQNLRDYMSWRQVDCHINNLYNTTFWALLQQGGMEARAAEQELAGTVSSDKNEILFSRFGINYNNEPEIFKKGSVLYRDFAPTSIHSSPTPTRKLSPELAHPRPRQTPRPMSQPLERSLPIHGREDEDSSSTPRGPTFLSTSTTPSPPPSPSSMAIPTFPFPQAFIPVSPSGNGNATPTHAGSKQSLRALQPLPLPPPTLKPSSKPPPSLNPPDQTEHRNVSPIPSPIGPLIAAVPTRTTSNSTRTSHFTSHSASASLSMASSTIDSSPRPATASASSQPRLKHRSPSLSLLEGKGPDIPLRISSIPLNNKPRKLSLPSQKSIDPLAGNDNNAERKASPPLRTMKELPSPPTDEHETKAPRRWKEASPSPVVPNSSTPRPPTATRRARSHSRGSSAPPPISTSSFPPPPSHSIHPNPLSSNPPNTSFITSPSTIHSTPQKANSSKAKSKVTEEGGWAAGTKAVEGRPKEMSRTQREKDRKKRMKAKVVIEHVDIIKDEFWERRPWILRGSAG